MRAAETQGRAGERAGVLGGRRSLAPAAAEPPRPLRPGTRAGGAGRPGRGCGPPGPVLLAAGPRSPVRPLALLGFLRRRTPRRGRRAALRGSTSSRAFAMSLALNLRGAAPRLQAEVKRPGQRRAAGKRGPGVRTQAHWLQRPLPTPTHRDLGLDLCSWREFPLGCRGCVRSPP